MRRFARQDVSAPLSAPISSARRSKSTALVFQALSVFTHGALAYTSPDRISSSTEAVSGLDPSAQART